MSFRGRCSLRKKAKGKKPRKRQKKPRPTRQEYHTPRPSLNYGSGLSNANLVNSDAPHRAPNRSELMKRRSAILSETPTGCGWRPPEVMQKVRVPDFSKSAMSPHHFPHNRPPSLGLVFVLSGVSGPLMQPHLRQCSYVGPERGTSGNRQGTSDRLDSNNPT
jgi:hypothetical protein